MNQIIILLGAIALVSGDAPINPQQYNNNNNNYNANNNPNNYNPNNFNPNPNLYNPNNNLRILRLDSDNNGESYNYNYETENGIQAQEQGYLKDADSATAQGSFAYTAPDGQHIAITYTADENGFLPQGAHIPTPPPIPEEILKALEQNRAAEASGIFDDGQYRPDPAPHQQYNQNNNQYNQNNNQNNPINNQNNQNNLNNAQNAY